MFSTIFPHYAWLRLVKLEQMTQNFYTSLTKGLNSLLLYCAHIVTNLLTLHET